MAEVEDPKGARPGGGLVVLPKTAGPRGGPVVLSCKFENMEGKDALHLGDLRVGPAPPARGNETLTDPKPTVLPNRDV